MQLVEQHIINRNDPRFAVIDDAAFKSGNKPPFLLGIETVTAISDHVC